MQFLLSLLTGIFIGASVGYLGSLMLSRRISLLGGPLGHLALPGVALGLLFGFDIFFGALFSIVLGAVLIWFFEQRTRLPLEAITAIVFASGVALGFLLLPMEHAEKAIIGDITRVGAIDLFLAAGLVILVFMVIRKIYRDLILILISEDLAKSKGVNVKRVNFIFLLMIAFVTALEVKIIGILLTSALFAIPAAAARNLGKNILQYSLFSVLIGVFSAISGILLFRITSLPAGPLMILSASFCFLGSLFFKGRATN